MWICSKLAIKATGRRQWRRFGVFVVNFTETATRGVVQEKVLLEISQNSQENTCARVPFLIKLQAEICNFIKKETLAQMFSCEICEISKNTFFIEHLRVTASDFKNRFYTLFWCSAVDYEQVNAGWVLDKIILLMQPCIYTMEMFITEAVVQRYSVKKLLSKFSQNSQKNICTWVWFLIKLQAPENNKKS